MFLSKLLNVLYWRFFDIHDINESSRKAIEVEVNRKDVVYTVDINSIMFMNETQIQVLFFHYKNPLK